MSRLIVGRVLAWFTLGSACKLDPPELPIKAPLSKIEEMVARPKSSSKGTSRENMLDDSKSRAVFRRALLKWYDANKRDLPWRKDRDPYRVWLSEIMLQQTRVAAVIEKYNLFLKLFPNVEELATASLPAVLAAWSGLGYYRRARALHHAARTIAQDLRGKFPQTAEAWRELPGIGRYTSAAIASIAFGEKAAVVDGNVKRVVDRLLGRRLPVKEVWAHAEDLVSSKRPGDFNQAMMELGATVCVPGEPKCLRCPVVKLCTKRGNLPGGAKSAKLSKTTVFYSLDHRNGKIRLAQRSKDVSVMPDMWELPEIVVPEGATGVASPTVWLKLKHGIMATDYDVRVVRETLSNGKKPGRRIPVDQLHAIPLTGLARKILKAAQILD